MGRVWVLLSLVSKLRTQQELSFRTSAAPGLDRFFGPGNGPRSGPLKSHVFQLVLDLFWVCLHTRRITPNMFTVGLVG